MDPIQLQCGNCGQMMGISPEHLGAQVQCPHCQAVVQTPSPGQIGAAPPALAASPPPAPSSPVFTPGEQESIFSQPDLTDDLFGGGGAGPRIEMPQRPPTIGSSAPTVTMDAPPELREQVVSSAPAPAPVPPAGFTAAPSSPAPPLQEDLAGFTPRRVQGRSRFVPILLIFLVPYAIFTTGAIGYLLYLLNNASRENPLRLLPDTAPNGKPRYQVKHDYELDRDMKTVLGKPIRVGAIEVTPAKVKHTPEGDLVLVFHAKNVSDKLIFNPISDEYMHFSRKVLTGAKPYTYLERLNSGAAPKLYGGTLEWFRGPAGKEKFDGEIGPGEEAVIHLTSELDYRKREVPNVVRAPERLLWRIQVRRGLVPLEGKMVSATTVIGVEFTARDIVKEKERNDG